MRLVCVGCDMMSGVSSFGRMCCGIAVVDCAAAAAAVGVGVAATAAAASSCPSRSRQAGHYSAHALWLRGKKKNPKEERSRLSVPSCPKFGGGGGDAETGRD